MLNVINMILELYFAPVDPVLEIHNFRLALDGHVDVFINGRA